MRSAPPIAWIAPSAIAADQVGRDGGQFRFRTDNFVSDAQLLVQQDGRLLHTARFRRLTPNLSARLDGRWIKEVDWDGGDLDLVLCDCAGIPLEDQ